MGVAKCKFMEFAKFSGFLGIFEQQNDTNMIK
jgi:hypothetical protein